MTILILTEPDDEHAQHMRDFLQTRNRHVRFLNSTDFPGNLQVSYNPATAEGWFGFPDGERVQFTDIESIYWRSFGGVAASELPDEEQAWIAENDARGLFESLLIQLPVNFVNGFEAFRLHQTKPAALARVAELGVRSPETVLTNDPDGVIEFIERHTRCIFKPVQGGAHTRRVELQHLTDDNLDNLRFGPVTLQEEIEGTDVRVFVAGERVLACEVRTETIDFRDDPDPVIEAVEIPDEIAEQSIAIARTLHLQWTGIDYRRTDDGEYVYFEANPSPMFIGFEQATGLPLTEALADLLCAMPRFDEV